jgi:hypothetical protein
MKNSGFRSIGAVYLALGGIVYLTSCVLQPDPHPIPAPIHYIRNLTKDSLQIQSQWPDSFHRTDKWELGGYQTLKPLWGANSFGYTPSANPADLRVTLMFYGIPNQCFVYSGALPKYDDQDIRSGSSSSYPETSSDSAVFLITQSIRDSAKPCE